MKVSDEIQRVIKATMETTVATPHQKVSHEIFCVSCFLCVFTVNHGSRITSNAGLPACRKLDEGLCLSAIVSDVLAETLGQQ